MKKSDLLITKAKAARLEVVGFYREDGSSRVSEYESMLDLFTLISLILIFAAFVYMVNTKNAGQSVSEVDAQTVRSGNGLAKTLPENSVIIVLYKETDVDKISILDGNSNVRIVQTITRTNVGSVLREYSSRLMATGKAINFCVDDERQEANRFIVVDMENWFAKNHLNYRRYFSGAD